MTMWTIDDRYETMPWDELDAVVFDVGNVLLSYSPEEELEAFFPGETELHEKLMEKIIKTPYWNMMDRGTLTVQQAIGHMTGRDRALEPMIRRFMENWLDFTRPIEEGVQAVKSCLAHGKRVFVLSNYQKESFATVESRFDFFGLFEGKVVSAREGLLKPNADIYEFLTNTYRVEPSRTLFIDDTPANIEGAMYVGWQGFCFNRPGKLAAFVGDRKGNDMQKIYAHRGASVCAGKTRFARLRWRGYGADGMELDVQISKDGRLVVFHDDELSRLTGFTGSVADYTYAELCRMPVIHAVDATERDVAPLLEDVLALLRERGLSVNIELKNSRAAFPALEEKTLEAVEKAGMREKTIYSSFNHYSLLKVRRLDPNSVCGLLYDAMLYQPWDYARQLGVQALHPHFSEPTFVTGEVEAAHRLGLSVNVWTVNEEADLRRMAEMNCDGIISNYPDVALRVLREVRG